MKHFVVQGIGGEPTWQVECRDRDSSALLFLTKFRAIDQFQRSRDIGSDRPPELISRDERLVREGRELAKSIAAKGNRMRW